MGAFGPKTDPGPRPLDAEVNALSGLHPLGLRSRTVARIPHSPPPVSSQLGGHVQSTPRGGPVSEAVDSTPSSQGFPICMPSSQSWSSIVPELPPPLILAKSIPHAGGLPLVRRVGFPMCRTFSPPGTGPTAYLRSRLPSPPPLNDPPP